MQKYSNTLSDMLYSETSQVTGYYQAETVFGKQLVCIAEYWLDQAYPFQLNLTQGTYAQQFINAYYKGWTDIRVAWCAIWPWFAINEVCALFGLPNVFPGYKDCWGSARIAAQKCAKIFPVLAKPKAGSVFYRKSKVKNSSGHMGIVVKVDEENQQYYTVEGNIRYSADQEGMGAWVYDYSDIQQFSFQFFDIGNYSGYQSVSETVTYKGVWECKETQTSYTKVTNVVDENYDIEESEDIYIPDCIDVTSDSQGNLIYTFAYKGIAYGAAKGKGTYNWYVNLDTSGNGTNYTNLIILDNGSCSITIPQGNSQTNIVINNNNSEHKLTVVGNKPVIPACVQIQIPSGEGINHFTAIKDYNVLSDIFDCGDGWHGVSKSARNGSALWYHGKNADPGMNTGFGIFKDDIGNDYYIVNSINSKGKSFLESDYLAKLNPMWIVLNGVSEGSGAHEQRAENLIGWSQVLNFHTDTLDADFKKFFFQLYQLTSDGKVVSKQDEYQGRTDVMFLCSISALIQKIEETGRKYDRPILFQIRKDDVQKNNLEQAISIAANLASSLCSIIPGVGPLIGTAIKEVGQIVIVSMSPGNPGLGWVLSEAGKLARMANMIAPDAIKGLSKILDKDGDSSLGIGEFLRDAKSTLVTFYNSTIADLGHIEVAKALGMTKEWAAGIFNDYQDDVFGYAGLIAKFSGKDFRNAYNKVLNYKNMMLTRKVRQQIKTGSLKNSIIEGGSLTSNPIMKDLFITGAFQSVFQLTPGVAQNENNAKTGDESIIATIFDSSNDSRREIETKSQSQAIKASMIAQASGYYPINNALDELIITSLQNKANDFAKNGQWFPMPTSIPPEKRECYEFEVRQVTNNIISCQDGQKWDANLKKCVSENVTVNVKTDIKPGGNNNSSSNTTTIIPGNNTKTSSGTDTNTGGQTVDTGNNINTNNTVITNNGLQKLTQSSGGGSDTVIKTDTGTTPGSTRTATSITGLILPKCISIVNGKYFYSEVRKTVKLAAPVVSAPVSAAVPNQLVANVPVNNAIDTTKLLSPAAVLPVAPAQQSSPLFSSGGLSLAANNSPVASIPVASVSGGLHDDSLPAVYANNKWYVNYPGYGWIPVDDNCKPVVPDVPPVQTDYPDCITIIQNLYYFKAPDGLNYEAAKGTDGNWYANYKGVYQQIINCTVKEPTPDVVVPPPPETNVPPPPDVVVPPPPQTNVPPPPPMGTTETLPDCITVLNSKYTFTKNGTMYTALKVPSTGKFYAEMPDGSTIEIIDCDIKIPVVTPKVPPPPDVPPPPVVPPVKKEGDCGCNNPVMQKEIKTTYYQFPGGFCEDDDCE